MAEDDKPTVNLSIRGLDEDVYHRLDSLKRKRFGRRRSWAVFFNWLFRDKSFWYEIVEAVERALKEEEKEGRKSEIG